MSLTSLLWPLLAPAGCASPQVLPMGGGAGLGTPHYWVSWQAGWAGLAGLQWPTSLSLPCAWWPSPPLPPPPGLPLRPLHRLVRALTCEIKRDFNYLSAKQQLERITAQQQSPPPLPLPHLSPFFSSSHPGSDAGWHRKSSNSAQDPCVPGLGHELGAGWGWGKGLSREAPQWPGAGHSGGASLCTCTLETASAVSLGSVCTPVHVCPCMCVCVWPVCVTARVCK